MDTCVSDLQRATDLWTDIHERLIARIIVVCACIFDLLHGT